MSISGKIETTANVATIIVAVLLTTVVAKTYVFPNTVARSSAQASVPEIIKGKSVDGQALGVDWKKNRRTLVLAISTTCHFCKDSVPFYQKLGATGTDENGSRAATVGY